MLGNSTIVQALNRPEIQLDASLTDRFHIEIVPPEPILELGPEQQAAILAGLQGLALVGSDLGGYQQMGQPLPIVGSSLGNNAALGTIVSQALVQQVAAYFASTPQPTTAGVIAALNSRAPPVALSGARSG